MIQPKQAALAIVLAVAAAAIFFTCGCSTTQQATANKYANLVAADAAKLQTDLKIAGPAINAAAVQITGTSTKAQKIQNQVSAVTTDAAAYAQDAQTLAQVIALFFPAPQTTGT